MILQEVISKEPLGPVTQADEFAWFNVVRWVSFVGAEGGLGKMLGLEDDWTLRAVRAVGNYSEIYERNPGVKSRLGIPRGLNQLWSMGGVLYAPPLR